MHGVGNELAHLCRTLPIDLQQYVVSGLHFAAQPGRRGRIPIAMDVRVLEKLSGVFQRHEARRVDEVIVHTIALARSRRTRGVGNRQLDA